VFKIIWYSAFANTKIILWNELKIAYSIYSPEKNNEFEDYWLPVCIKAPT